jgi:hypothetical protein
MLIIIVIKEEEFIRKRDRRLGTPGKTLTSGSWKFRIHYLTKYGNFNEPRF